MKRFLLFVFCACYAITYAQIVSPGTGITLTFNDLVYDPSGAVTSSQPGVYEVHQNLTLAANDTLLLDASTMEIYMDAELSIQVHGCVRCASRDDKLIVSGVTTDASSTLFELRFEDAEVSILSNLLVEYCQQILVSNSPITFDNCEFRYFNSQVIKYMNCNPIIRNCYFHDNQSAAVNSGVNVMGSPIIRNNQFYHNVLSNVNQPQLNLGPGSVNDTIFKFSPYTSLNEEQRETCLGILNGLMDALEETKKGNPQDYTAIVKGLAGTGKTTVIETILDNIERVHGRGTSFLLMSCM